MAVVHVDSASTKPRHEDLLGMPPQAYRGGPWDPDTGMGPNTDIEQRIVQPGPGAKGKRTVANASKSGFNIRGVLEVLAENCLDPVAELSRTLMEKVPVTDINDVQLFNKETGEPLMKFVLPLDIRTKTLAGLIEYVHPKLKSVEMNVKKAELTDEQVEQRLAALLLQAQQAEAKKD